MNKKKPTNNKKKKTDKKKKTVMQKVLIALIVVLFVILLAIAAIFIFDSPASEVIDDPEPDEVLQTPEPEETPEPTPEPTPTPEPVLDSFSPLTGLPMEKAKIRNRPLAVVLNNIPESLPMNGVSDVDIIYEVLVEGGITRMLALYQDISRVEKVGSIRSARHYTVEIANSYDAILASAGASPQALSMVRQLGIPHLNEVEGPLREIFFRDRNRVPGRRFESLHSVVLTGERVAEWLPKYDFRLVHEEDREQGLIFVEDGTPRGASAALEVSARFSSGNVTDFTYKPEDSAYFMREFNRDFIDANDSSNPAFTNILILQTSVTSIRGDAAGRLNVETTGEGVGYFVCGGKYIEIDWVRADKDSPFKYSHKDGSPLEFGIGRTYICIIPNNMDVTFS